ncbi:MAG TPA: hypothetical protein VIF13_08060 [Hyphomicrobium sp.]
MRIAVRLDRSRLLRWHLALIEALQQNGHAVAAEFRPRTDRLPASLVAILELDAIRGGSHEHRLSGRVTPTSIAERAPDLDGVQDLTIDLSTSAVVEDLPGRVLCPLYDGSAADEALFHALLRGRAPLLSAVDTYNGGTWTIGLPALEQPTRFTLSLDHVASRLVEGLVRIVADIAGGQHAAVAASDRNTSAPQGSLLASTIRHGVQRSTAKLGRIRDRTFGDRPRWRVAWRHVDAGRLPASEDLRLSDFRVLEDDGRRFYADPFVVMRDGIRHVFVEELPSDTGIGIISHFTISASEEATKPTPILQTGSHLSYPLVFEHEGETWMMPESSAAGGLDLYRCRRFPDDWTLETRLLEGRFHDATLFAHDGRLWIAAATEAFQSSSWDALSLFYADALKGPWTAHAQNPVLVDARFARPAGPLWRAGVDLFRPAQECSGGYGSKLSIRKILRLTPTDFSEETAGTIAFGDRSRVLGPHTICRGGDLELIDLYGRDSEIACTQRKRGVR